MTRGLVTALRRHSIALTLVLASCSGDRAYDLIFDAGSAIDDTDEGELVVEARLERCPRITLFGVAPLQVGVGGMVQVVAEAREGAAPARGVSFRWSASTGMFTDSRRARTSYRCTSAGAQTLHLVVENRRGCSTQRDAVVTCVTVP